MKRPKHSQETDSRKAVTSSAHGAEESCPNICECGHTTDDHNDDWGWSEELDDEVHRYYDCKECSCKKYTPRPQENHSVVLARSSDLKQPADELLARIEELRISRARERLNGMKEALDAVEKIEGVNFTEEFKVGDRVWQFADAKTPEMLMVIVKKSLEKSGDLVYTSEYLDKDYLARLGWKKKYCKNLGKFLRSQSIPYPEDFINKKTISAWRKELE